MRPPLDWCFFLISTVYALWEGEQKEEVGPYKSFKKGSDEDRSLLLWVLFLFTSCFFLPLLSFTPLFLFFKIRDFYLGNRRHWGKEKGEGKRKKAKVDGGGGGSEGRSWKEESFVGNQHLLSFFFSRKRRGVETFSQQGATGCCSHEKVFGKAEKRKWLLIGFVWSILNLPVFFNISFLLLSSSCIVETLMAPQPTPLLHFCDGGGRGGRREKRDL